MQKRKRIVVITRNLPPLVGGMERLIWHCIEALRNNADIHVIGPVGCGHWLPKEITTSEIPIRPLPLFLAAAAWTSIRVAYQVKPEILFAGSGLTAPFALLGRVLRGGKAIVYLHGFDVEANNWLYQQIWVKLFRRLDRIIVNSSFTRALASRAGVPADKLTTIHPGVSLPDFTHRDASRQAFRQRYDLGDSPTLLYIGRITARKGLAPFVRHILPKILSSQPDARLVVIGSEPHLAAHRQEAQMPLIRESLRTINAEASVIFLGERALDDPVIGEALFAADAHIFPVQQKDHDNEGFGMVAIEAAAHGLPTVAFSAGGVMDAVSDGVSGRLVNPGDYPQFAEALIDYMTRRDPKTPEQCRRFASQFAWPRFDARISQLIRDAT